MSGQHDSQMHIYDDLDVTSNCSAQQQQQILHTNSSNHLHHHQQQLRQETQSIYAKELADPQKIAIESLIRRGEFSDICAALLRAKPNGNELPSATTSRVVAKILRPHPQVAVGNERTKQLEFLLEAALLSRFEHPNILRLEAVVTRADSPMIVTEFMENGQLDLYLRDNKERFSCVQLISMLRGIANGMQYLAKLNYVHKNLAAHNILVTRENVCKISGFSLGPNQQQQQLLLQVQAAANGGESGLYTNESTTSSSSVSSSNPSGSSPATASSTLAAAAQATNATTTGGANNLVALADQLAAQQFASPQQNLPVQSYGSLVQQAADPKLPVRWMALEALAFNRFTPASDVWSFGVLAWEVMTHGERPYWNWSNQDVVKAVEQGFRLTRPEACPEQLYKLMLDCWLKDRLARPNFGQILKQLDNLLSPYDDPFCQQQQQQQVIGQQLAAGHTQPPNCPPGGAQLMANFDQASARQRLGPPSNRMYD